MNFYGNYKSPLGYQTGENHIDSYGVDHSGFTTRDEIEYQMARQQRENQIIKNYNNHGITQDYPQAGTNFWGNTPDNNFGFGSSQISSNIENMQKSFYADYLDIPGRANLNNTSNINGNTLGNIINNTLAEAQSYYSPSNMMSSNNYYNPMTQSMQKDISSILSPKPLGNDANSYQLAQNIIPNTASDVGNLVKPNIIFDDVYYSELGEDGNVVYKGTNHHEGGYSDRLNDLGGPTNYGVTQDSLNEYNNWNSPLRTGFNFPIDVEKLTPKQAKQIMDEMYYQRYNINKLQNLKLARNTFDAEVNQGTDAGKMLSRAMNEFYGYQKGDSPKYFYENQVLNDTLANAVNKLTTEEAIKVNDILTKLRMEKYFQSVDKNPIQNVNNINGWYNRTKSYYSNPQEFEQLYRHRVDDYIQNKYPQFYNGQ